MRIFTLLFLTVILASVCFADIINVPDDFETIQEGIEASEDGDTVLVAPGEYLENISFQRRNITLLGDPENPEEVIINANEDGTVIRIDRIENEAALIGFTITGGYLERGGGAGIFMMESNAVIKNCRIVENRTINLNGNTFGRGAGIDCSSSELTISDCEFLNNRAGKYGGGIQCLLQSVVNINNCVFNHNGGAEGAHVGCWESVINIVGCEFTDATYGDVLDYVIGLYLRNTDATIEICNIHDGFNSIRTVNSDVTIDSCNFDGNNAGGEPIYGGALMCMLESHVTVTRSVFTHNWAFDGGHAAYSDDESEVLLANCTITQQEHAGGQLLIGVDVLNSIVWGNASDWYQNCTFSFSNVQDGDNENGNIDADPLFVDPENGDLHLTVDSPCIDAGDPESDPDPDGTRADMGAFHFHQRDIDVNPLEVQFPPIEWDTFDSLSVTISNIGRTGLTIDSIGGCLTMSCIWMNEENRDEWEPIVIEPQGIVDLWIYYRPQVGAIRERTFWIYSDDPDEPEITVHAEGDVIDAVRDDGSIPDFFNLVSVYPNPFNASTTITYTLPFATPVSLKLYDLSGREVITLVEGELQAGCHQTVLSAGNLPSGLYIVKLEAADRTLSQKVMLIR